MVELVKGSEAWRYDTICALCRGVIAPDEDVYVVGAHVLHVKCLEWLLSRSPEEFEEILRNLPLDTHEELRGLYKTKALPRPEAKPEAPKVEAKPETPKREERPPTSQQIPRSEKLAALERFRNRIWAIYHCVEERDEERWKYLRERGIVDEAIRLAEEVDRAFGIRPPLTFREHMEAVAGYADRGDWGSAMWGLAHVFWKMIALYEDVLRGRDPSLESETGTEERGAEPSDPEGERELTREERRRLWDTARSIVDEALRAAGLRRVHEMKIDGLASDTYARFIMAVRDRVTELLKPEVQKRMELRIETYLRSFGDTHVFIDGEYYYTWRPQFETIASSFWGWVRRVYNLLKTLAERGLLKEEVFAGVPKAA